MADSLEAMTAARRPHPDDIALPSRVGVSGRSAGGNDRGDTVFHPSNAGRFDEEIPNFRAHWDRSQTHGTLMVPLDGPVNQRPSLLSACHEFVRYRVPLAAPSEALLDLAAAHQRAGSRAVKHHSRTAQHPRDRRSSTHHAGFRALPHAKQPPKGQLTMKWIAMAVGGMVLGMVAAIVFVNVVDSPPPIYISKQ